MQTKTHLALGHYLLAKEPDYSLHRYSGLFLMGCMEPDYNLATYLRGLKGHGVFHGHNAANSFAYVSGCLDSFEESGPHSGWDYFRLGAMFHYVADAFTGPHNEFWTGNIVSHAVYELKLHDVFVSELDKQDGYVPDWMEEVSLLEYFEAEHKRYCESEKGLHTDSRYIVKVCSTLLRAVLDKDREHGKPVA